MKKEEFYFDSKAKDNRIHAVKYMPDDGKVWAVLQIVHGMSEYVERYQEFAEFMTQRGYLVVGEDHLGHGKSVQDGGLYGYFCEQDPATVLVQDVHSLQEEMHVLNPDKPYFILGHSMGSFIVRNYLCQYGNDIDGAVIMGTGMQAGAVVKLGKLLAQVQRCLLGDRHIAKMIEAIAFGGYTRHLTAVKTRMDWLSRDRERVQMYLADPFCGFTFTVNGFRGLFELISRMQNKDNLRKMPSGLPVLMVSGTADPVGADGKGVQKAYHSFVEAGMEAVTLKLYPEARHELLNEINRDEVGDDILHWLEEVRIRVKK